MATARTRTCRFHCPKLAIKSSCELTQLSKVLMRQRGTAEEPPAKSTEESLAAFVKLLISRNVSRGGSSSERVMGRGSTFCARFPEHVRCQRATMVRHLNAR